MVRQARIALARERPSRNAINYTQGFCAPRRGRGGGGRGDQIDGAGTGGAGRTGTRQALARKIRFVSIGTGIRGCDLLRSARKVPNGECVGTADLYDMHQKGRAWRPRVPTFRRRVTIGPCSTARMWMR